MPKPTKTDLAKFRRQLEAQLANLRGDVGSMRDEALRASDQDNSVDHLADQGTDNYDQGFMLGLIENEEETIQLIEEAIDRIDGKGEWPFGACPRCMEESDEPKSPKAAAKAEAAKDEASGKSATATKGAAKAGASGKSATGKSEAGKSESGKSATGRSATGKASATGKGAAAGKSAAAGKAAATAKSGKTTKSGALKPASVPKAGAVAKAVARASADDDEALAPKAKLAGGKPKGEYWIPMDRLEYVPWARYCVRHQEEAERRETA